MRRPVIQSLADTYREKFDDLSEKAQEGERGMAIDLTAGELESMADSLADVIQSGEPLCS
jgi:hypothetical protein